MGIGTVTPTAEEMHESKDTSKKINNHIDFINIWTDLLLEMEAQLAQLILLGPLSYIIIVN